MSLIGQVFASANKKGGLASLINEALFFLLTTTCVVSMFMTDSLFLSVFTAKVPFPLTLRFKGMLQRGIELKTLSASW